MLLVVVIVLWKNIRDWGEQGVFGVLRSSDGLLGASGVDVSVVTPCAGMGQPAFVQISETRFVIFPSGILSFGLNSLTFSRDPPMRL